MDHQEDIRFNRYDYDNLDGAANSAVAIDDNLDGDCKDSLHQVGDLFRNREKKERAPPRPPPRPRRLGIGRTIK